MHTYIAAALLLAKTMDYIERFRDEQQQHHHQPGGDEELSSNKIDEAALQLAESWIKVGATTAARRSPLFFHRVLELAQLDCERA